MTSPQNLRPAARIEPEESMRAFFEGLKPGARDVGADLQKVVGTVVHRSVEAAWPSMLAIGRRLAESGPMVADQWRFEATETGNPWQVSFAARQGGADSGVLFVIDLVKERTEAALAARNALLAAATENADVSARRSALAKMLIDEIVADDAATAVTEQYRDPAGLTRARQVSVYAFKDKDALDFHDGYAEPLAATLEAAGKGAWSGGLVARCSPTPDHLAIEPREELSDRPPEMAAALGCLRVLSSAISAAKLEKEVRDRGRLVASWAYQHCSDEMDAHLAEAAQVAVYCDSGFAAQHSWETVWEFWKDAVEIDLTARVGEIHEIVAMLRDGGYVSMRKRYDCNDMDDHACVVMDDRKFGTLWLETPNGKYCVRFGQDSETLTHVALARVDKVLGRTPLVLPMQSGFLGSFKAGPGRRYLADRMGRFHDRTVRDINNILLTLDSVHCCLKEDRAAARMP